MTLRIVEMLREHGVVGKFVEFHGLGLSNLSLPDVPRLPTWLQNMVQLVASSLLMTFPDYMRLSGRDEPISKTSSVTWLRKVCSGPRHHLPILLDCSQFRGC